MPGARPGMNVISGRFRDVTYFVSGQPLSAAVG